jgi:hypothetical protein
MPPLPDIPNVLVVQLRFKVGNANVLSRVHLRYASPEPSRSDLNVYAAAIDTEIGTHLLPLCSLQVRTVEVMVTDLTHRSAARGIAASQRTGTRPGLANGAAVAALINFTVARRYRGGKPRVYLPFFVASDLTTALTWSEDALADASVGWAAFMTGLLTCAPSTLKVLEQVNISHYEGFEVVTDLRTGRSRNVPQLRPGGPAIDTITKFAINPKPGSQRRRNLHGRRRRVRRGSGRRNLTLASIWIAQIRCGCGPGSNSSSRLREPGRPDPSGCYP